MVDLKNPVWQLYDKYLDEMSVGWSETTYKSEKTRLKQIVEFILSPSGTSGAEFHKKLKDAGYGSYTIKTLFIRASHFYDFGKEKGVLKQLQNPFRDQMVRAKRQFVNAYVKEHVKDTFYTAEAKLQTIQDQVVRDFCIAILKSGLRIHEAYKVDQEKEAVIGKGLKERATFFKYEGEKPCQSRVRAALKEAGLKPHTLRKLFVRRLAQMDDISRHDIMKIMGWSSYKTADSYFEAQDNEKLKKLVIDAVNS